MRRVRMEKQNDVKSPGLCSDVWEGAREKRTQSERRGGLGITSHPPGMKML